MVLLVPACLSFTRSCLRLACTLHMQLDACGEAKNGRCLAAYGFAYYGQTWLNYTVTHGEINLGPIPFPKKLSINSHVPGH